MTNPNSQVTEQARELLAREYEREGYGGYAEGIRTGDGYGSFAETAALRAIEAALTARTEDRPNELDVAIAQRDALAGKLEWLEESVRNAGCEIDYSATSGEDCVWNRRAEDAEAAAPPAAEEGFVVVPVATASHAAIICDEWKLMFAETVGLGKFEAYSYEPGVDETRDELRAAIAAARPQPAQGDGWLPIESAPRDGTPVLLLFREDGGQFSGAQIVGRCNGDLTGWRFAAPVGYAGIPDCSLAGWRPLPPPPAPADGGEK